MTLPRRVPPEPSAQKLLDALEPLLDNADGYDSSNVRAAFRTHWKDAPPDVRQQMLDLEETARHAWKDLRAAYAVDAPPPVVTVAQLAAWLGELGDHDFNVQEEAEWLYAKLFPGAHLVPPEAP